MGAGSGVGSLQGSSFLRFGWFKKEDSEQQGEQWLVATTPASLDMIRAGTETFQTEGTVEPPPPKGPQGVHQSTNSFSLPASIIYNGLSLFREAHTHTQCGREKGSLFLFPAPCTFPPMKSLHYLPMSPILHPDTCHLTHQAQTHNLSAFTVLGVH